jgi:mannose-6-phosphate isomerase-like protein (cupin superfamily)
VKTVRIAPEVRILLAAGIFSLMASQLRTAPTPSVKVLRLTDGVAFQMGNTDSRRIIHPGMGARNLTLNYSVSSPGHEFPQHVHDYSDDTFLVLQGQVDVRQGNSRRPLLTNQAAFVPSGQIHGTITTGTGTAILISFQCPPDMALYEGRRDSSRPGAPPPKGVITPGAVKILNFGDRNGFFTSPGMGSARVAAAHWRLKARETLSIEMREGDEQLLFVWKGALTVRQNQSSYAAGERDTVFLSGKNILEARNESAGETVVIQVQAPPRS